MLLSFNGSCNPCNVPMGKAKKKKIGQEDVQQFSAAQS